jgi:hypothetical protein
VRQDFSSWCTLVIFTLDLRLKTMKEINENRLILADLRPQLETPTETLAAMILQAEFIAEEARQSKDQESFQTRLLWTSAYYMIEQATRELSMRN